MRTIIYRFLFCFLIIFSNSNCLYSQSEEGFTHPTFTPPSPSAYELGRYGEVPIGLFTGSPDISVPLYDFNSKELSIPLFLHYNSNGIKVDQLSTKVGLGWNLFSGGIITRTVRQNPDELRGMEHPDILDEDFMTPSWINYFDQLIHQIDGISQPINLDGEPDNFVFNFLGRTGEFTYNNDHEIVLLNNFSLKVIYDPEGEGGFLIIDEKGVEYYFYDEEISRIDSNGGQSSYNNIGRYMTTSWSLSKVITPKNDIINFHYSEEDYQYVVSESQFVFIPENPAQTQINCGFCPIPIQIISNRESPIIENLMTVKGKRLSRINSNNPMHGSVDFFYSENHPEVNNYSLLTTILVKNNSNKIIENINLAYSNIKDRMFLDNITFMDPDKKYSFDYQNQDQIPNRLSKSKDHWGYHNGSNNAVLYSIESGPNKPVGNRFAQIFGDGANKEIDENKAKYGLLKRITYPTRGYTEIDYESNSYRTTEEIGNEKSIQLNVSTDSTDPLFSQKSDNVILDDILTNQVVPLQISFGINYPSCFNKTLPEETDQKIFLQIENLTNPTDNKIISRSTNPASKFNTVSLTVEEVNYNNNNNIFYSLNFKANNSYKITVSVFYQCLAGEINFTYENSLPEIVSLNKKTGGLRVSKVTNYDVNNTITSLKKYHYAAKDNLNISSGNINYSPNYLSVFTVAGVCINPATQMCCSWLVNYLRVNSNNFNLLYPSSYQTTRYQYVTISEDSENFLNGGVEHKFKLSTLYPGSVIFGTYLDSYSYEQVSWGDGLELEKTYFKSDGTGFTPIRKEINDYKRDPRVDQVINAFKGSHKVFIPCRVLPEDNAQAQLIIAQEEFNITRYYKYVNWFYLSSKTIETYDINGESPYVQKSNYYYDNPSHYQITRTETINSKGEVIKKQIKYPQDIPVSEQTDAEKSLLYQNRIGEKISVISYLGTGGSDLFLNRLYYKYHNWGDNLIEIQDIYSSIKSNVLEKRINFHDYDQYGNPLMISKNSGSVTSYFWGYNGQYPIAKVENATYSEIASALSTTSTILKGYDESNIAAINTLRSNLPKASVTTYTYEPLVGLRTVTNPRGLSMSYEYDSFNRLEFIKNETDQLLKQFKYHYKN